MKKKFHALFHKLHVITGEVPSVHVLKSPKEGGGGGAVLCKGLGGGVLFGL